MSRIPLVQYRAPPGYPLDVELYRGPELRRRASDKVTQVERLDFHVLLYLTRGGYQHMVDFEDHRGGDGSVILVQPGRVHRFGDLSGFHGWMLIFRSEVVPPDAGTGELPAHTRLPRSERGAFVAGLRSMANDTTRPPSQRTNALLVAQLRVLWLRLAAVEADARPDVDRAVVETFRRFRALVEQEHTRWHTVAEYAKALGCAPRTLTRASTQVAGLGAKRLISDRLVTAAKRRLGHSSTPVYLVADELGFSEATNFVKFFRRETGTTPNAFRRAHSY